MPIGFPPDSPLHAFSEAEVDAIFAAGTEQTIASGDHVIVVDEPGDSMFFVVEGTAEARLQTGRTVRNYGPGSYFGELSFIKPGHKRSTSILATSPLRVQVLDQRSI